MGPVTEGRKIIVTHWVHLVPTHWVYYYVLGPLASIFAGPRVIESYLSLHFWMATNVSESYGYELTLSVIIMLFLVTLYILYVALKACASRCSRAHLRRVEVDGDSTPRKVR